MPEFVDIPSVGHDAPADNTIEHAFFKLKNDPEFNGGQSMYEDHRDFNF